MNDVPLRSLPDPETDGESPRTFALWLGYAFRLQEARREGITRFCINLGKSLLKRPEIHIEIWCYEFNATIYRDAFAPLLEAPEFAGRVVLCTQLGFNSASPPASDQDEIVAAGDDGILLEDVANRLSRAECYLIPHCVIDSGLYLKRPKILVLHDIFTLEYAHLFVAEHKVPDKGLLTPAHTWISNRLRDRAQQRQIRILKDYARQGTMFVSNCDTIRNRVLEFLPELDRSQTSFVYLPVVLPPGGPGNLRSRVELTERFGLVGDYLFYPTQIRPYKNVGILLEALHRLRVGGIDLKLALTGRLRDCPSLLAIVERLQLQDHVLELGDVSEVELFSLHRHAVATVVPTLSEGGIPWQTLEAIYSGTPAVTSKIPMVEERLVAAGMTLAESGLLVFDPHDAGELCDCVRQSLACRDEIVAAQRPIINVLSSYSWDDVAANYLELLQSAPNPRNVRAGKYRHLLTRTYCLLTSLPPIQYARRHWRDWLHSRSNPTAARMAKSPVHTRSP